jgi:beta-lactamase superfamily II metal-dependent hydrolase
MKKLRIIIFHVEHGFCGFIKSPNGYTLLIDCGSTDTFSPIKYIIENELYGIKEYNGHKLTKFVLSHPHNDHLSDIERLITDLKPAIILRQKYNWDEIKIGDKEEYENLDIYSEWQEEYNQRVISPPDWGMSLTHGIYLSPEEAKKVDEERFINNSSIPTFIEYKGWKIIFPGDLETSGWIELLKKERFKEALRGGSFFVTSHHGHSSGYCKEIYDVMGKPYFNIVSTHKRNENVESAYSKPENAKGVKYNNETRYMFSTRYHGTIIIEIGEDGKATFDFLQLSDNIKVQSFYRYL